MELHRIFYTRNGKWTHGCAYSDEITALDAAVRFISSRWAVAEEASGKIERQFMLDADGREFIAAWCLRRAKANGRLAGQYRMDTGKGCDFSETPYTNDALADAWRDGFETCGTEVLRRIQGSRMRAELERGWKPSDGGAA